MDVLISIFAVVPGTMGFPLLGFLVLMICIQIFLHAFRSRFVKQKGSPLEGCDVSLQCLMSREQAEAFRVLEPFAKGQGLKLHAEVSLAAIFKVSASGQGKRAHAGFATFRQKRVDMLLTNARHIPVCGIEYHGSGHWGRNAKKRDAAKRLAFEAAGLPLVEVTAGSDLSDLPKHVTDALNNARGASGMNQSVRKEPKMSKVA